jgi:hypothetical protein
VSTSLKARSGICQVWALSGAFDRPKCTQPGGQSTDIEIERAKE